MVEKKQQTRKAKRFNGLAILVSMFRAFDPITKLKFYKKLEQSSPLFLKLIQEHEFLLEDLLRLDEISLQRLLYQINDKDLLAVWTFCSAELKAYLKSNMSARRYDDLSHQILHLKVENKERFQAQSRILKIVTTMISKGSIAFRRTN